MQGETVDSIQWPRAKYWTKQWNPVIGCKPCSPACENCYAAAWARRFGRSFEPHATKQKPPRSGIVFCGNMTDLFGEWRSSPEMVVTVRTPPRTHESQYLWLTKRVVNMVQSLRHIQDCFHIPGYWYGNHYFGFTAESQEWYDKRLGLRSASGFPWPDWANLWVSCEPLLGPIDLGLMWDGEPIKPVYKWVVVGCESGPKRRPCKIEWVESIVEQCKAAEIPVFVKQLDINGRCETDINKFPAHLRIRQVPWASKGGLA